MKTVFEPMEVFHYRKTAILSKVYSRYYEIPDRKSSNIIAKNKLLDEALAELRGSFASIIYFCNDEETAQLVEAHTKASEEIIKLY